MIPYPRQGTDLLHFIVLSSDLRTSFILCKVSITPLGKQYWTRSIADAPPTVAYESVMKEEGSVLEWLHNVVNSLFLTLVIQLLTSD